MSLYHNRALRPNLGVKREYLLAGFARAMLPWLISFLRNGVNKYLIGTNINIEDPAGMEMQGDWCRDAFLPPDHRGRSATPQKDAGSQKKSSPGRRKRAELRDYVSSVESHPHFAADEQTYDRHISSSSISISHPRTSASEGLDLFRTSKPARPTPLFVTSCKYIVLPPTPSASPPAHSDHFISTKRATCSSNECINGEEMKRHNALRQGALKEERMRSRVLYWWMAQTNWAKTARSAGGGDGQLDRIKKLLFPN